MKKIYLVTSGKYSDYRVDGVFNNKELAKKFTKTFGGDIEEYKLNPLEPFLNLGYKPYKLEISLDGKFWTAEDLKDSYWYDHCDIGKVDYNPKIKLITLVLWAKNKQHAIKIAREKRREFIVKMDWEIND